MREVQLTVVTKAKRKSRPVVIGGRSIASWLNNPEYFYQPRKLLSRLVSRKSSANRVCIVELPWKLPLEVDCSDTIGLGISHHGLFELPVVEAIFRLVDPVDNFVDIGANIGYMTSAALAAGAKNVISFEPHPNLFARLSRNIGQWIEIQPDVAGRVWAQQKAISAKSGSAALQISKANFMGNQGIATLETS
jgi:hypothetical protein